ncbi:hypothetical protein A2U01_0092790, partial [Trifolium medium]|nr:hypothetical protein [Trifolium medium]
LGLRASRESSELCDVWMSIELCLGVMFSMMKLITGGEMLSKGWKLVEPSLPGLVSRGDF